MHENDVAAAVGIKPVGVRAAQRRVDIAVSDDDARASPWMQGPKWGITKGDVGQQKVPAASQFKQMSAGVVQSLMTRDVREANKRFSSISPLPSHGVEREL
jgi:hypothetical protein